MLIIGGQLANEASNFLSWEANGVGCEVSEGMVQVDVVPHNLKEIENGQH